MSGLECFKIRSTVKQEVIPWLEGRLWRLRNGIDFVVLMEYTYNERLLVCSYTEPNDNS